MEFMSKIYEYSYDDYINAQKALTNSKFGNVVYVRKETIGAIYENFKNDNVRSLLCHGTRSGEEQNHFISYFNCYVMGSELSEKAVIAPNTTIWDFNKVNEEWVGKFDLVYTNAFDHCITPSETIAVWRDQLTPNGRLLIEWSDSQNGKGVTDGDPLNATEEEVTAWAEENGMYLEKEIMKKKCKHAGTVLVYKRK
jgi:hypothetical protein